MATEAPPKPADAVRLAAATDDPESIPASTQSAATQWFLDPSPQEAASDGIELNVGGPVGSGTEKWVPFRIQVVDRQRIRDIREEAKAQAPRGEDDEVDEMEANLRIAVDGLLDPNVKGDPKMRRVRGQDFLDPGDALKARFAHKPGLIDQIAGKIVQLSGYDEKDIREVRAAGN